MINTLSAPRITFEQITQNITSFQHNELTQILFLVVSLFSKIFCGKALDFTKWRIKQLENEVNKFNDLCFIEKISYTQFSEIRTLFKKAMRDINGQWSTKKSEEAKEVLLLNVEKIVSLKIQEYSEELSRITNPIEKIWEEFNLPTSSGPSSHISNLALTPCKTKEKSTAKQISRKWKFDIPTYWRKLIKPIKLTTLMPLLTINTYLHYTVENLFPNISHYFYLTYAFYCAELYVQLKELLLLKNIKEGNLEAVKLAIENNVDIAVDGDTPLTVALVSRKKETKEIASMLIHADPIHQTLSYAKECIWRKVIAHFFEIKGSTQFIKTKNLTLKETIDLEGLHSFHYFLNLIEKGADVFNKAFPNFIDVKAQKILKETYQIASEEELHSDLEIFQRWQQGLPALLKTGYLLTTILGIPYSGGHHVTALIWNDFFVVCNRGDSIDPSNKTVKFFKFKKENLTPEIIKCIKNIKTRDEYISLFHGGLANTLGFYQTDFEKELENIDIPLQTVGNCTWANSEAMILPLLLLADDEIKKMKVSSNLTTAIQKKKNLYQNWLLFQQANLLQGYINKSKTEEQKYNVDFDLLSKAFAYPLPKSRIDERIIWMWEKAKKNFISLTA